MDFGKNRGNERIIDLENIDCDFIDLVEDGMSDAEDEESSSDVEQEEMSDDVEEDEMSVEYTVFGFKKFMETELSWKSPQQLPFKLWAFWSHQQPQFFSSSSASSSGSYFANKAVKQRITSALCSTRWVSGSRKKRSLLIQFWAATNTDRGRCVLTTRDQPFALMKLDRGFSSYRKHSLLHTIKVDDEEHPRQLLGLCGRVYRNKLPESTPNVACYSTDEFPRRDIALRCGVLCLLALPVFEHSRRNLLGVLELVSDDEYILRQYSYGALEKITQLKFPFRRNFLDENILQNASKELNEVLQVVCQTHQLPLAQSWVIGSGSLSCSKDVLVVSNSAISERFELELVWLKLKEASEQCCLKKDQGLVGKALLLHKPCFCRDITRFSMTEYPLAHYATDCGSIGSFTICVHSFITGNKDYVLEFFFPSREMDSKDPSTLLSALLTTLKEHFRTFKIASGGELGEELCVEVVKSSSNNEPESFKICQPNRSLPEPNALENEGEMEAADPFDQQLMVEDALQQDGNVLGAEGKGDMTKSPLEKAYVKESSERECKKTGNDISYGVLKENFGRPLEEVAKSLNVSWSTFKRLCRKHDIPRWPSHKRNKVCGLSPNETMPRMQATNDVAHTVQHVTPVQDKMPHMEVTNDVAHTVPHIALVQNKMPLMQVANDVAHTVPHITLVQDLNAVTVKATYNGVNIKFQLSFSSGMAELEENVTKRLHLEKGNFSIKYKDEDDSRVLVACDEDLQDCMNNARLNKTAIRMLVGLPITHLAP